MKWINEDVFLGYLITRFVYFINIIFFISMFDLVYYILYTWFKCSIYFGNFKLIPFI